MKLKHAFCTVLLALTLLVDLRAFALPASDNCSVDNFGTNWTVLFGGFGTLSGECRQTAGGATFAWAAWTADSFNSNHYAQALLGPSDADYPAVCVRLQGTGSGTDGYCFLRRVVAGSSALTRIDNGAETQLGADFGALTGSTIAKLEANGSTLTVYFDGVSQGTRTDSTYTGGSAGIGGFGSFHIDDFQADNVGGGGETPKPKSMMLMGCCQ